MKMTRWALLFAALALAGCAAAVHEPSGYGA